MSDSFPLINLRQTIDKQWSQIEIVETFTISSSRVVKLKEVPDDGTVHPRPVIQGLTETTVYPPSSGQFFVNYCTGYIEFDNAQIGSVVSITYWGKGSLVEAADINYLNNKHVVSATAPTGYYGQQWYNTITGITYCYDVRNKWLSIDRNMFSFGRAGLSNNQYLNFYGGVLSSIISDVKSGKYSASLDVIGDNKCFLQPFKEDINITKNPKIEVINNMVESITEIGASISRIIEDDKSTVDEDIKPPVEVKEVKKEAKVGKVGKIFN